MAKHFAYLSTNTCLPVQFLSAATFVFQPAMILQAAVLSVLFCSIHGFTIQVGIKSQIEIFGGMKTN